MLQGRLRVGGWGAVLARSEGGACRIQTSALDLDPPKPAPKPRLKTLPNPSHPKTTTKPLRQVITGDNRNTAEAVCRAIGLFSPTESLAGKSFTGREFSDLGKAKQLAALGGGGGPTGGHAIVFSRAEPRHKQDIVRLLKEMGEVVAMTGDGAPPAPPLGFGGGGG